MAFRDRLVRRARRTWDALPAPLRGGLEVARDTLKDFRDDKAIRLAAALAYYSLFALGPILVIAISVAGLVLGEASVRQAVVAQAGGILGADAARVLGRLLEASAARTEAGIVGATLGTIALLVGAGGAFGQLQDALNTVWEVRPRPGRGWKGVLKDRFFSLLTVVGSGFLLLVSLVVSAALAAATSAASAVLPGVGWMWSAVDVAVSVLVVSALFAIVYRVVPDAHVRWRYAFAGGVLGAVLFALAKWGLGLYLGRGAAASATAAAGAVVVLMVWVWWSALVLFLGAELAQVLARRNDGGVRPERGAVRVGEEQRRNEGLRTGT